MADDILVAVWVFLPAALANAVPVPVSHLPGLRRLSAPIDGGRMFRGKALFGTHKTWRGLISGMVVATLTLWVQQMAAGHFAWLHAALPADYASLPTLLLGPLLGFGALAGDAVESFFKRQRGVAPGHSWFPFDQLDYIIGGVIASLPFIVLTPAQYVWMVIVWLGAHLGVNGALYLLGWKDRPL